MLDILLWAVVALIILAIIWYVGKALAIPSNLVMIVCLFIILLVIVGVVREPHPIFFSRP